MVFDPQQMKWLKLDSRSMHLHALDPGLLTMASTAPGSISVEEEEDPFADIPDLKDEKAAIIAPGAGGILDSGKENTDWVVGEEFDLGPSFIKRQRTEEAEWRKKVAAWMGGRDMLGEEWKWEIRRVADQYNRDAYGQ
jgi:hypothetical protein